MRLRVPGCDHEGLQNYDEWESKQFLTRFGIPVPDGRLASAAEAPTAAAELEFPVAVKFIHKDITHKTDLGALHLHLTTKDEVGDAVADYHKTDRHRGHQRRKISSRTDDHSGHRRSACRRGKR